MVASEIAHAECNLSAFYLGRDLAVTQELDAILKQKGLTLSVFVGLDDLTRAALEAPPGVLIVETASLAGGESLDDVVDRLAVDGGAPPALLVVAERDDIEGRLAAMRVGALGYFPVPVALPELASRALQAAGTVAVPRYRILVVDDDPAQAKYIGLVLANAGMDPQTISEPLKVLDAIRGFRPDLILLDLYMPQASGGEIAAIVRDQDDCFDLPIVFLSSENDREKQMDALRLGGDSFLVKPLQRNLLVATIEHRIGNAKWLAARRRTIDRRESATGLIAKERFMRQLDRTIHTERALGDGRGAILVDVDSPQDLLDRIGISGAERLMMSLETTLENLMEGDECACRLSDFGFALLARRSNEERLSDLADNLCRSVMENAAVIDEELITPTASVGVAPFSPRPEDAATMISRAQRAAFAARMKGGNQVQYWQPAIPPAHAPKFEDDVRSLIEDGLHRQAFLLLYQPVISLNQDSRELHQAQVRLRTADGELIPAKDFLPVAERSGLIEEIDHWSMTHAMDATDLHRALHPRLRLLVRQSVRTVSAPEWMTWFRDQIVQRNLLRTRPLVDLRLIDLMCACAQGVPAALGGLKRYGIGLCVSDVYGEPEEQELLARVSPDLVRLAPSTVANSAPEQLTVLIRALRDLGSAVIAPGIDEPSALRRIWSCRPDYIQGSHLGMPSVDLRFDFARTDGI